MSSESSTHSGHPVGTLVKVNRPSSVNHGTVCRVSGPLEYASLLNPLSGVKWEGLVQDVDIPPLVPHKPWAYQPSDLIPVYDGNEPVSWEDCVWQPSGVSA